MPRRRLAFKEMRPECALLFQNREWPGAFSAGASTTELSPAALHDKCPALLVKPLPKDGRITAAATALISLLQALEGAAQSSAAPTELVLATDSPLVVAAARPFLENPSALRWSLLALDVELATGASHVARAAVAMERAAHRSGPGRAYSLKRGLCSIKDELQFPAPGVPLMRPHVEFLEDDPRATYVVNGDNWSAPGAWGRHPSLRLQLQVEQRLAALDGIGADRIVTVGGGIYGAFDLICQAFGIYGTEVALVGPVYGGLEKIMLLRYLTPRRESTGGTACAIGERVWSGRTRLAVLTHPALYTAADMSAHALELAETAPSGSLLVIDECYIAYLANATRSENLRGAALVIGMRGLSKLHGLAGLRLGYTVSTPAVALRLRSACAVKGVATPVLQEALRELSVFDKNAALKRETLLRQELLDYARELGMNGQGEGPYVVIECTAALFESALGALSARGIYMNPCTSPNLIYQPAGGEKDIAFRQALQELKNSRQTIAE